MNSLIFNLKKNWSIIWKMSIVDMKRKYKASILSWFWLFLQPALMVFMYWFAFSTGSGSQDNFIFEGKEFHNLQWLIIGVLTWNYCGDILLSGPTSLRDYSWISKSFGVSPSIPPIFVNLSKFIVGSIMIFAAFVISMIFNGVSGNPVVTWHSFELPVIMILMFIFMCSWSYFLSSLVAISRDMQNIIGIIPMLLGWISGVFVMPAGADGSGDLTSTLNIILQVNPFNFIVNGIRSSTMGYASAFVPNIYNEWYGIVSFFGFTTLFISIGYFVNKTTKKFLLDIM
ncbi:MAG: ABC transporter permease [Mycoplasma sp.]